MIENIKPLNELLGLARSKNRSHLNKTVDYAIQHEYLSAGWQIDKKLSKSVRLRKSKPHNLLLEDRVWMLLYRMGFLYLSGEGGGQLSLNQNPDSPSNQIDVIGIDDELTIAIECKSSIKYKKRPQFQEELGKHALIRERLANSVNAAFPCNVKRRVVLIMFLSNIELSDNDRERAKEANVVLFDENDLTYYESLVSHLGQAAKYQFFADMLPGKKIKGLTIRVPAVRTKINDFCCYTFAISPEYLLKISYISHRAKGRASDVHTYQRMVSRSRLKKIRDYISNDGIFPTNIVINLESKFLNFERIKQDNTKEDRDASGILGWLDIKPTYKSAWIIDGQHRLFAYSGHDRSHGSHLAVLAFEGLPPSKQAALFIDINAKQKSVKQSLLQELYAELHWDADDPAVRVRAIISKAIQTLDEDPQSPLYQCIQKADSKRNAQRCITLTSIFGAIEKTDFFIAKEKGGQVIEYGPLWAGNNYDTLKRTVFIISSWLSIIRHKASDWWDLGASEGGGLAMNEGIIACLGTLKSVFNHLEENGNKLVRLDNDDLLVVIKKYAESLGDYFSAMSYEERKVFRALRGVQGQTTRRRRCEKALKDRFADFKPNGLEKFLEVERAQTNIRAQEIISRIEITLQSVVIDELKREFGENESEWWTLGVPKTVRLKAAERMEDDNNSRGSKDRYFDILHYRKIILANWRLFEPVLGYEIKGNKEKRTMWISEINDIRNRVAHASSGAMVSIEELSQLQLYDDWLATTFSKEQVTFNILKTEEERLEL